MKLLALLLGLVLASPCFAASGDDVQTPVTVTMNGAGGTTTDVTFGSSVICGVRLWQGSDPTITGASDTASNVYALVADSPGDSDSGTPNSMTAFVVSHDVMGGFTVVTVEGLPASRYGHITCWEVEALAASPDDQTCTAFDPAPQASDATCSISTLAQANERIFSVMTGYSNDGAMNISGPTGASGSWSNIHREQDAITILAGSSDSVLTSATTGGAIAYSHDDLIGGDWAISVLSVKLTATTNALLKRRRMLQ